MRDVELDTEVEMMIPDEYVSVIQERLNLYTELNSIETEEELEAFRNKLIDRFGPVPKSVHELFSGLRIRWLCKKMGFDRFILKNGKMITYKTIRLEEQNQQVNKGDLKITTYSFIDEKVSKKKTYNYQIRAELKDGGSSPMSKIVSVKVK